MSGKSHFTMKENGVMLKIFSVSNIISRILGRGGNTSRPLPVPRYVDIPIQISEFIDILLRSHDPKELLSIIDIHYTSSVGLVTPISVESDKLVSCTIETVSDDCTPPHKFTIFTVKLVNGTVRKFSGSVVKYGLEKKIVVQRVLP